MKKNLINTLSDYVETIHPIIYINHFDFTMVDSIIAEINKDANIIEFNNAFGAINFKTKAPQMDSKLEQFLKNSFSDGFNDDSNELPLYIVLKDVHCYLEKPEVIALLKRFAEYIINKKDYKATIFIVCTKLLIPFELENYITIFDIPSPTIEEITQIINTFCKDHDNIDINEDFLNNLATSCKGLNEFQIKQILYSSYYNNGTLEEKDKKNILQKKEQFVKKSGMLEIINVKDKIDDIGGLENLKKWLGKKANVFKNLDKALRFGVDIPKGVMILGMPGCGKSLTAKATAHLFNIPLVRFDIGKLLGKYVGESEDNMRRTLKLAESISPCVLWIDEIEKAFSGVNSDNGHETTSRLFGHFLTWMQEKESYIFIVATANDVSKIPPEFLRKGRFDEIFSINLPNLQERAKIIEINLKKRKKWHDNFDVESLATETDGFNGSDLESVVKETIEEAFLNNKNSITNDDLLSIIANIKSISSTMKDKIEEMKEKLKKMDIKPASE